MENAMGKIPNVTKSAAAFSLAALLATACAGLQAEEGKALSLSGASEVPPVTSAAKGSGQIMVGADHSVSGSVTVSGFAPTAAHIHEAAAGKNGPVAVVLSKSGDNAFAVPPGTKLTDAQYASYEAGNLYVNVHSAEHPGGEIRVQLMPAAKASPPMRSGGY